MCHVVLLFVFYFCIWIVYFGKFVFKDFLNHVVFGKFPFLLFVILNRFGRIFSYCLNFAFLLQELGAGSCPTLPHPLACLRLSI